MMLVSRLLVLRSTRRRWPLGLLTVGVGFILVCANVLSSATAQEPVRGGRLVFGSFRDVTGFDPHNSSGAHGYWFLGNIYDSLLEYALDGTLAGGLAESWAYTDPLTLTLTLRQGVTFHDGTAFDAEDVIATLARIRDPESAAVGKTTVDNIASVTALDDYTVEIKLIAPDFTLLHAFASNFMYVISAEDIEAGFDFSAGVNGTGPFVLTSWEPERHYVLNANPSYWRPGLPYLDEYMIQVITDDRARTDALRSGQVDIGEIIPWQDFVTLERDFAINKFYGLSSHLRMNHTRPPLDDVRVRQAIAYILDRQEVNDLAFGGEGIVMDGPLQPPGSPYYFEELEGRYARDWDRALELLQEAGYASPSDVPPLQMAVSVSALATQPGLVVQQQLQSFGLRVEWITVDVPTLVENRRDGTYVLHIDGGGLTWPDPDYLRTFFHSTVGTSHATGVGYKNDRLDELLELGNVLTDFDERRQLYLEAEEILLEELPIAFILWRPQADAVASYVHGYPVHAGSLGLFNSSKMEYVWVTR